MATKRLTIELSVDQYEALRQQASRAGTTITGVIRRLVDELRFGPSEEGLKNYRNDPMYKRRGSFDGPKDLAENHDHYLYGRSPK